MRHLPVLADDDRMRTGEDQHHVLAAAFAEMEILTALVATIAYWGTPVTDRWWLDDIARFAIAPNSASVTAVADRIRLPGVVMATAAGVAAIAAHRDDLLYSLFHLPEAAHLTRATVWLPVVVLNPNLLNERSPTARMYHHLQPIFVDHRRRSLP